jgi:DNA-binding LytR/AlgR family response regulator
MTNKTAATTHPTALIAEDEHLLAQSLQAELARVWPALQVVGTVGDGASAVRQALALQPDVLFFDIRMPAMSGLEAAAELIEQWPTSGPQARAFPQLVFVTAYDQYAVQAFEAQAVDYLLKPVQTARLLKTVEKLQLALAKPQHLAMDFEATLNQLRGLMASPTTALAIKPVALLTVIQASVGNAIRMVPIEEVLCFEAADKYVRVLTAEREYLIRTPLKELQDQLDSTVFWQIHRGTIVRALAIEGVTRDEGGKATLTLRGLKEKFVVSRLYSHLFKAM